MVGLLTTELGWLGHVDSWLIGVVSVPYVLLILVREDILNWLPHLPKLVVQLHATAGVLLLHSCSNMLVTEQAARIYGSRYKLKQQPALTPLSARMGQPKGRVAASCIASY